MSQPFLAEKSRKYTPEEVDRGLTILALTGSPTQASEQLEAMGHVIPHQTLSDWRRTLYPERYSELAEKISAQVAHKIAAEAEEVVNLAAEAERKLLKGLIEAHDKGKIPARDLAGAIRNLSTTKGINIDKVASPLRGRPRKVEHVASPQELFRALEKLGLVAETNGTEEIVDAVLVAGAD